MSAMKLSRSNGFTLIELMITVAIVAILAAVAYPAYTDSVLKGRRAQARTALAELLLQQERYKTQRNCYIGFTTNATAVATASAPSPAAACGGVTPVSVPMKTFSGDSLSNSYYRLEAAACTGTSIADCVNVSAIPLQNDPKVGTLSMSSTGRKSCSGTVSASNFKLCWP
ncbi:type IV pilin protein [Comamonas guangdongensis]|uniref:Type IV pilin protein n=1 Tax=Comamonas guangdongensis TaxID=510515 RepID=A0ABV3ZNV6_9BURK